MAPCIGDIPGVRERSEMVVVLNDRQVLFHSSIIRADFKDE